MAKILCVDDIPDNVKLLACELEDEGHAVRVAMSGEAALAEIERERPDLILLDILMPKMTGLEVLREVRREHAPNELPILMATVLDDVGDVIEALRLGANDYVTKPLEIEVVLARIGSHLRNLELTRRWQTLSRHKDELMSIVVHDLRQPLTALRLNLAVCKEEFQVGGPIEPDHVEAVDEMFELTEGMSRLMEDFMSVHVLESGKLPVSPRVVSARAVVEESVHRNAGYAASKHISLAIEQNADVELFADHARLVQVLSNLVHNAIKFGPVESRVRVRASQMEDRLCVEVSDEGPGVPPGAEERLFKKFGRLDNQPSGEKSTGLGLYIARMFAEAHGGTVDVRSNDPRGATFRIDLPIRRPSVQAPGG